MRRIESHAKGLGTVTRAMVEQRARELAVIAGRTEDEVTASDRAQAKKELTGNDRQPVRERIDAGTESWNAATPSPSRRRRSLRPRDDRNTELLVKEGVAEADHDRRLAGRKRRKGPRPAL